MLCFHFGVAFIEKGGDVRCWRGLSSVHILVSNVLLQSIELSTCSCVPIDCRWGGEDSALAADALASLWLRRGSTPSPELSFSQPLYHSGLYEVGSEMTTDGAKISEANTYPVPESGREPVESGARSQEDERNLAVPAREEIASGCIHINFCR